MITIQDWVKIHGLESLNKTLIKAGGKIAVIHPKSLASKLDLFKNCPLEDQAKAHRFYGHLLSGDPNRCFWIYRSDEIISAPIPLVNQCK